MRTAKQVATTARGVLCCEGPRASHPRCGVTPRLPATTHRASCCTLFHRVIAARRVTRGPLLALCSGGHGHRRRPREAPALAGGARTPPGGHREPLAGVPGRPGMRGAPGLGGPRAAARDRAPARGAGGPPSGPRGAAHPAPAGPLRGGPAPPRCRHRSAPAGAQGQRRGGAPHGAPRCGPVLLASTDRRLVKRDPMERLLAVVRRLPVAADEA
jgi:hypothetical protein